MAHRTLAMQVFSRCGVRARDSQTGCLVNFARSFLSLAVALGASVALFAGGCGGRSLVDAGDAGGDARGPEIDGSNACGAPPPDCIPTGPMTCQQDCNSCHCFEGGWGCTTKACPAPTCPSTPPASGSYCNYTGPSCTFNIGCGPQCDCVSNQWKCLYPPCPPPVCPPQPPSGACGSVGESCTYGFGCNVESCQCTATPQGPQWTCLGEGCVDAGTSTCGAPPAGCVSTSSTTCKLDCNTCTCDPQHGWGCTAIFCPVDAGH
jgi:hypothetical protein